MTREERHEFLKVLEAHVQTVGVAEACAVTTRDLAAEVLRGGLPKRDDLQRTIAEAERVLGDLVHVRKELERVMALLK